MVDAHAKDKVEALVIAPQKLRSLLIAEAELGERIMRALILRRVGLIETGGGGPIIVGPAENSDVLRLENFLSRNGHPHLRLDPKGDIEAKALIERFNVEPAALPIVLCPGGQLLQNPSEMELARCIGLIGPIDRRLGFMTWQLSARALREWRQLSMQHQRDCRFWYSIAARSGDRQAPPLASRII